MQITAISVAGIVPVNFNYLLIGTAADPNPCTYIIQGAFNRKQIRTPKLNQKLI